MAVSGGEALLGSLIAGVAGFGLAYTLSRSLIKQSNSKLRNGLASTSTLVIGYGLTTLCNQFVVYPAMGLRTDYDKVAVALLVYLLIVPGSLMAIRALVREPATATTADLASETAERVKAPATSAPLKPSEAQSSARAPQRSGAALPLPAGSRTAASMEDAYQAMQESALESRKESQPVATRAQEAHQLDFGSAEEEADAGNIEDRFWAQALEEFSSPSRNQGLYAKLFSQHVGDQVKVQADYLRVRARRLAHEDAERRAIAAQEAMVAQEKALRLAVDRADWKKTGDPAVVEFANGYVGMLRAGRCFVFHGYEDLRSASGDAEKPGQPPTGYTFVFDLPTLSDLACLREKRYGLTSRSGINFYQLQNGSCAYYFGGRFYLYKTPSEFEIAMASGDYQSKSYGSIDLKDV